MATISEKEFADICRGIDEDRASIIKHNPLGTESETLLWMLLNTLVSYLSLSEIETPCFTGSPDEATYLNAIGFVLNGRRQPDFDPGVHIDRLIGR